MASESLGRMNLSFGPSKIYYNSLDNEMYSGSEDFIEYSPKSPVKSIKTLILQGYYSIPALTPTQVEAFGTFFAHHFNELTGIENLIVERSFPDELWIYIREYFLVKPIEHLNVDSSKLPDFSGLKTLISYTHNVRSVKDTQLMLDEAVAPHMLSLLAENFATLKLVRLGECTDAMHELIMSVMGRADVFKLEVIVDLSAPYLNDVLVDMNEKDIDVRLNSPTSHVSLAVIPSKFEKVTLRFSDENAVAFIEPFFLEHKTLNEVVFEMLDTNWTPEIDPFNILIIPFLQRNDAVASLTTLTIPTKNTLENEKLIQELVVLVRALRYYARKLKTLKIKFMGGGRPPQGFAARICGGGFGRYRRSFLTCDYQKPISDYVMTQEEQNALLAAEKQSPMSAFHAAIDRVAVSA